MINLVLSRNLLVCLLGGVSAAALAPDTAYAAQNDAQQTDAGHASEDAGIGEIIVTAQKRAENVQDVPISISAFTAEALQSRGIADVTAMGNLSPNVSLDAGTPFSGSSSVLSAFVRGIGQNDFAFNLDPGVGVYLDGIYLARSVGANQDLLDVERVEILKGPRATSSDVIPLAARFRSSPVVLPLNLAARSKLRPDGSTGLIPKASSICRSRTGFIPRSASQPRATPAISAFAISPAFPMAL